MLIFSRSGVVQNRSPGICVPSGSLQCWAKVFPHSFCPYKTICPFLLPRTTTLRAQSVLISTALHWFQHHVLLLSSCRSSSHVGEQLPREDCVGLFFSILDDGFFRHWRYIYFLSIGLQSNHDCACTSQSLWWDEPKPLIRRSFQVLKYSIPRQAHCKTGKTLKKKKSWRLINYGACWISCSAWCCYEQRLLVLNFHSKPQPRLP